ncbi:penicillin-binding protein 1C [Myxococcota bacterium]
MSRRSRRRALVALGAVVMTAMVLASIWPLPDDVLALGNAQSTIWVDRHGARLAHHGSALDTVTDPVSLDQVSPDLVLAILAAEDHRFFKHPGIDALATARAAWQNLCELRIVSGGSTITQQLARLLYTESALLAGQEAPARDLWQKLKEARLALRLEVTFDKDTLLEAFLSRAPFGNLAVGIEAASHRYFGVGADSLSLAQAAYLAGLPKGPTHYNPIRWPERAQARQRYVLGLMLVNGMITGGQHQRALAETVGPSLHAMAHGFVHAIDLARTTLTEAGLPARGQVELTIDARLQRDVAEILATQVPKVYGRGGRSAAAVVIDNASGDVLALVGAAFAGNPLWGHYNAATATRQPGSALKPFIYAAALDKGLTAATLAADIERPFPDTWGVYMPDNYDLEFHGPVRFREALAQSLNVAAVDVLFRVGVANAFQVLDDAGLKTLDRRPSFFGLGLTLGSGGVRPIDLTNAYAALARGGVFRPWRIVQSVEVDDQQIEMPPGDGERILDERIAFVISDILSDHNARIPQFGERSILRTPYWTAVKTGTSKGFRDNWTIGYTRDFTVGVWVGHPRGLKMHRVTGAEGAGTMWRKITNRVTGHRSVRPDPPAGLTRVRICHVSGHRIGPHCEGGLDEYFLANTEPTEICPFHRRARIDPDNDLLVPDGCDLPDAPEEVVTVFPSPFDAWAQQTEAGRAERYTPRCPPRVTRDLAIRLVSPAPTETVRIDADVPREYQALHLQAAIRGGAGPVTFLVDGEPFTTVEAPHVAYWPIQHGRHLIAARFDATGMISEPHVIVVY